MSFTYTIDEQFVMGNKRVIVGTFTSAGGSTGGDILTGLNNCDFIQLQQTGAAVIADAPVANETFPVAGGAITIVTTANAVGKFMAIGY
jgi:hypothetical protein